MEFGCESSHFGLVCLWKMVCRCGCLMMVTREREREKFAG